MSQLKKIFFSDRNCHSVIDKLIEVHYDRSGELLSKKDPNFLKKFRDTFLNVFTKENKVVEKQDLTDAILYLNNKSVAELLDVFSNEKHETMLDELPEEPPLSTIPQPTRSVEKVNEEIMELLPISRESPKQTIVSKKIIIDNTMINETGKVELNITNVKEIEFDSIYFRNIVPNLRESFLRIRYNLSSANKELFTEWTSVAFPEGFYSLRDLCQTLQKGSSHGNFTFTAHVAEITGKLVFKATIMETARKPNSINPTTEIKPVDFEIETDDRGLMSALGLNEKNIKSLNGEYYCKFHPFYDTKATLHLKIEEIGLETIVPLDVDYNCVKYYKEAKIINTLFETPLNIQELTLLFSEEQIIKNYFELTLIIKKLQ